VFGVARPKRLLLRRLGLLDLDDDDPARILKRRRGSVVQHRVGDIGCVLGELVVGGESRDGDANKAISRKQQPQILAGYPRFVELMAIAGGADAVDASCRFCHEA